MKWVLSLEYLPETTCRGISWKWLSWRWKGRLRLSSTTDGNNNFRLFILSQVTLRHQVPVVFQAKFNYDLGGLMVKLQDVGERQNYAWIRTRIERMWPSWTEAARRLEQKQNMTGRDTKRVGCHELNRLSVRTTITPRGWVLTN